MFTFWIASCLAMTQSGSQAQSVADKKTAALIREQPSFI